MKEITFHNGIFRVNAEDNATSYSIVALNFTNVDIIELTHKFREIHSLSGIITDELEKDRQNARKRLYDGITTEEVLLCVEIKKVEDSKQLRLAIADTKEQCVDDNKKGPCSDLLKKCLKKLRANRASSLQKKAKEEDGSTQDVARRAITYKNTDTIKMTTTKLSKEFYSVTPPVTEIDGQMCMNLRYSHDTTDNLIPLPTSYSFNETIEAKDRKLINSAYAFFVGLALNNLYLEGNEIVTPSKILEEMGDDTGSTYNIKKLMKHIRIGQGTIMEIDCTQVAKAWKKNVKRSKISTPIYPVQIKEEEEIQVRGNVTDTAIHITALSPFYIVGETINQLTMWDKRVLRLYQGNRTERYYRVLQYLLQEIAWIRNDKSRQKVFDLNTIYKACGDHSREMKEATKTMVWDLLRNVFEPLDYIHSVKEDELTGNITFKVHTNRKPDEAKITKLSKKNDKNH